MIHQARIYYFIFAPYRIEIARRVGHPWLWSAGTVFKYGEKHVGTHRRHCPRLGRVLGRLQA